MSDKIEALLSFIKRSYQFWFHLLFMQVPPNKFKSHSWYRATRTKKVQSGKNSGELKVGIDIPLKTIQIVGWRETCKEFRRDAACGTKLFEWLQWGRDLPQTNQSCLEQNLLSRENVCLAEKGYYQPKYHVRYIVCNLIPANFCQKQIYICSIFSC